MTLPATLCTCGACPGPTGWQTPASSPMRAIAIQLAQFYQTAARPHIDSFGTASHIARALRQNFRQTGKYIGRGFTRG